MRRMGRADYTDGMPEQMLIEIASDVVCPWCYIGKRRLEKALAQLGGEIEARIEWLPFQLNPGMPEAGMARADYRRAKFGSAERSRALDARVAQEGAGEGIAFAFDRMQRTPSTIAAHRLIDLAQSQGRGNTVVDALFRAYFEEALDIGNEAVLKDIAERGGVKGWPEEKNDLAVEEKENRVRELGISGVPTFIFNRKSGVSGAYPPEMLVQAIREVRST
jgi:predicted DsbA family dithiol-disulfide isomerase